jgi:hypothetical protein
LGVTLSGSACDSRTASEKIEAVLAGKSPVMRVAASSVVVVFQVVGDADDARLQVRAAMSAITSELGIPASSVFEESVERSSTVNRRASSLDEYIAIDAVAQVLGISTERALELAQTRTFPEARMAVNGKPLWRQADLVTYRGRRARRRV